LAAVGLLVVQDATPFGPTTTVLQLVATKLLPALGPVVLQLATGVGPLVIGAGQVVVVKLFAATGDAGVQVAAGSGPVLTVLQTVLIKLGLVPVTAVQVATGVATEVLVLQVVVIQLGDTPADAVQLATGTLVVTTGAGQEVVVQELAAVAVTATQAFWIGTLVVLLVLQTMPIQLLPAAAVWFAQVCTGTLLELLLLQVMPIQLLLEDAVCALQVCTG